MGSELVTRGLSNEVARKHPDGTWLSVIDYPCMPEHFAEPSIRSATSTADVSTYSGFL